MTEPLSYHVYCSRTGEWFNAEEGKWTSSFFESTAFETFESANAAMTADADYVFACMPSA